jgi:hypothetical protein
MKLILLGVILALAGCSFDQNNRPTIEECLEAGGTVERGFDGFLCLIGGKFIKIDKERKSAL